MQFSKTESIKIYQKISSKYDGAVYIDLYRLTEWIPLSFRSLSDRVVIVEITLRLAKLCGHSFFFRLRRPYIRVH